MNFTLPLRRAVAHDSLAWHDSGAVPGVRYAIRKVSLAQRIELAKRVRELCLKNEFLNAGNAGDRMESALADLLIRKLYMDWGLAEISGLRIDGRRATVESVAAEGPERLTDEIVESIKSELGLTDEERKNS